MRPNLPHYPLPERALDEQLVGGALGGGEAGGEADQEHRLAVRGGGVEARGAPGAGRGVGEGEARGVDLGGLALGGELGEEAAVLQPLRERVRCLLRDGGEEAVLVVVHGARVGLRVAGAQVAQPVAIEVARVLGAGRGDGAREALVGALLQCWFHHLRGTRVRGKGRVKRREGGGGVKSGGSARGGGRASWRGRLPRYPEAFHGKARTYSHGA